MTRVASTLLQSRPEAFTVTRRNVGLLMAMVGSALGGWWLMAQQRTRARRATRSADERGRVIYDNTPTPSGTDAIV